MKAVALESFDSPPALREDFPAPRPAPNEVLVRVRASSVNPADNGIATGMLKQMGVEYEFPVKTRPTCANSASANCCPGMAISLRLRVTATPTASTQSSTW